MPTKEYQEAVSELLDILENTDEELVKKIPPELIVFWEKNKSEEYIPEIDHNLSLEEMNLKTKTKKLIAMIYLNYLCDSEKRKDIKKIIRESEKEEEKEKERESIGVFKKNNQKMTEVNEEINKEKLNNIKIKREDEEDEDLQKVREDMYMIKNEKNSFFSYIIKQIRKFFRKIIY